MSFFNLNIEWCTYNVTYCRYIRTAVFLKFILNWLNIRFLNNQIHIQQGLLGFHDTPESHKVASIVLPYAHHHNPLLVINRSWILTIPKSRIWRKKSPFRNKPNCWLKIQTAWYNGPRAVDKIKNYVNRQNSHCVS